MKKSSHPWREADIFFENVLAGYSEGADPPPASAMAGFFLLRLKPQQQWQGKQGDAPSGWFVALRSKASKPFLLLGFLQYND